MNSVSPETEIVRFNDESIIVASAPDVETTTKSQDVIGNDEI